MLRKFLVALPIFALSNLALVQAHAAKPKCKDEACYCEHAVQAKGIFGGVKAEDFVSVCKTLKDDKEMKKYQQSGSSGQGAEKLCLEECGDAVTKEALVKARKDAEAKAKMPDPPVLKLLKSSKTSFPCDGDGQCVCTDAVSNKGPWQSTCKRFHGGAVVKTFEGKDKKEAVETCSRLCFGAQSSMIVSRGDGTWQAKP